MVKPTMYKLKMTKQTTNKINMARLTNESIFNG
jgi:hypothetical protein